MKAIFKSILIFSFFVIFPQFASAATTYESAPATSTAAVNFTNGAQSDEYYLFRWFPRATTTFDRIQLSFSASNTVDVQLDDIFLITDVNNDTRGPTTGNVGDDSIYYVKGGSPHTGTTTASGTIEYLLGTTTTLYPTTFNQNYLFITFRQNVSVLPFIYNTQFATTSSIYSENGFTEQRHQGGIVHRLCDGPCDINYFEQPDTQIDLPELCSTDPRTRIVDFNPQEGSLLMGPTIDFDLSACINEEDLGTIKGVTVSLHNIDQNVLIVGQLSPSDILLLNARATSSGPFYFATSSILGDGNYRVKACVERSYFATFIKNPFSGISDCQSHQFVVGSSTFIGNISQNLFGQTNDFFNGLTATSSESLALSCNPFSGNFGIRECTAFLFIPSAGAIDQTMTEARTAILTKAPWGYMTRFYDIMSTTSTSSLPAFTASVQIGNGSDLTPDVTTIEIDPSDMIAGAGNLLDTTYDPINGKNIKDVAGPMVRLTIALMVLFIIISDLAGMYKHANEDRGKIT